MISVCIATYNGEIYIEAQLSSVLAQLGPYDEIILSDDCSTDATLEKVKSIGDSRIKILTSSSNLGYSKNFEKALKASVGDIIFICDQDDVWFPNKVERTNEVLTSCDMVISNAVVVDSQLNTLVNSHFTQNGTKQGFISNFLRTRYIGACMAFKRSVLKKALPFPDNSRYCAYDYWLTIVGELFFSVKLIEEPLILYRRHSGNASTGGQEKSPHSLQRKIMIRLYALSLLIMRTVR